MKHLVILIIALIAISSLSAVIRTVDNNIPSTGQYTTFAAAQTASVDGDTIYVYPSLVSYGTVSVTKLLTVIGGGVNPANPTLITSKIAPAVSQVGGSNSLFIGLEITNGITNYYPASFSNCIFNSNLTTIRSGSTFTDCLFKSTVYVGDGTNSTQNVVFTGCTFQDTSYRLYLYSLASCVVYNSIFMGNNYHIYCAQNQTTAAFYNSVFLNSGTGTQALTVGNTESASLVFTNCIMEILNNSSIGSNFVFQYCIYEGSSANITGPGNQQSVNLATVMVNVNGGDYHLITGSPAIGAGQYGVDIGLYGGPTPFDDLWFLTFLANITDFDCPPIVDQSGNLQLHIEAQCGN